MKKNKLTNCLGNDTKNSISNFKSYLLTLIPFYCHKLKHEQVVMGQIGMCKAALPRPLPWAFLTCQFCAGNAFKAISPHFSVLKSYLSKFPYNMFLSRGRQWNLFFLSGDFSCVVFFFLMKRILLKSWVFFAPIITIFKNVDAPNTAETVPQLCL